MRVHLLAVFSTVFVSAESSGESIVRLQKGEGQVEQWILPQAPLNWRPHENSPSVPPELPRNLKKRRFSHKPVFPRSNPNVLQPFSASNLASSNINVHAGSGLESFDAKVSNSYLQTVRQGDGGDLMETLLQLPEEETESENKSEQDFEQTSLLQVGAEAAAFPISQLDICKTCVFVIERIKKGTDKLLPSICSEIVSQLPDNYPYCHFVLDALASNGNNARYWLFEGCYKYEVYEAKEWIRPCPSHVMCSELKLPLEKDAKPDSAKPFCKPLPMENVFGSLFPNLPTATLRLARQEMVRLAAGRFALDLDVWFPLCVGIVNATWASVEGIGGKRATRIYQTGTKLPLFVVPFVKLEVPPYTTRPATDLLRGTIGALFFPVWLVNAGVKHGSRVNEMKLGQLPVMFPLTEMIYRLTMPDLKVWTVFPLGTLREPFATPLDKSKRLAGVPLLCDKCSSSGFVEENVILDHGGVQAAASAWEPPDRSL